MTDARTLERAPAQRVARPHAPPMPIDTGTAHLITPARNVELFRRLWQDHGPDGSRTP